MHTNAYNDIYDKLVDDDTDIMGVVAYAFYKKHKIEWIQDIHSQTGVVPTAADYAAFYKSSCTPVVLNGFRQQAEAALNEFLEPMYKDLGEKLQDLENQFSEKIDILADDYQRNLVAELKEVKTESFWMGAIKSAVGSILFVFIVAALYFFLWAIKLNPIEDAQHSVDSAIEKNYNKKAEANLSN